MPVTLKLSDDEARDLAEMLSNAATVAASNQQDGAEGRGEQGKRGERFFLEAQESTKEGCVVT